MKSLFFNGLLMGGAVLATFVPMRDLPDRIARPPRLSKLHYSPVQLAPVAGPLRIAGAWQVDSDDPRMGGLSALAIDRGRFIAVSDLGAVASFDPPSAPEPQASIRDLEDGPGNPGFKTSRDAESLARDRTGQGWWIGFEQRHSIWHFQGDFAEGTPFADLDRPDWRRNRGVEGLLVEADSLLLAAENGREAMRIDERGIGRITWAAEMEVADAATAPDGSQWLLLRGKGLGGIVQAIAPLVRTASGYRIGVKWPLPKAPLDNYEGMVIAPRPGGGWRYWLVTDDGHRIMARTLLVALDLDRPPQKQTPDVKRRASTLSR